MTIKKIILSLMLAITTVLSVSFYDINCSNAVFYWITAWLHISPVQNLVTHPYVIISGLLINIGFFTLIYCGLLFKINNIKKRYLFIACILSLSSMVNLFFLTFMHGNYTFFDKREYIPMVDYVNADEPLKTKQISFFFNYKNFNHQQCQPFN